MLVLLLELSFLFLSIGNKGSFTMGKLDKKMIHVSLTL
jgi:hypothetical protein